MLRYLEAPLATLWFNYKKECELIQKFKRLIEKHEKRKRNILAYMKKILEGEDAKQR